MESLEVNIGEKPKQWINECSEPWLKALLLKQSGSLIPWQEFIAVGTLVRLRSHENPKNLVDELLQGRLPDALDRERQWARSLDKSTIRNLVTRAMTLSDTVSNHLYHLFNDFRAGNIVTKEDLLYILHLRDDLESGLFLLEASGYSHRVLYQIPRAMDQWAEEQLLLDMKNEFETFEDERLLRASVVSPNGWWVGLCDGVE